jgi:hypothetical protein
MADLARRKKEDAIRLKAWLEPHLPSINRLQAILLWLDTTGTHLLILILNCVMLIHLFFPICTLQVRFNSWSFVF